MASRSLPSLANSLARSSSSEARFVSGACSSALVKSAIACSGSSSMWRRARFSKRSCRGVLRMVATSPDPSATIPTRNQAMGEAGRHSGRSSGSVLDKYARPNPMALAIIAAMSVPSRSPRLSPGSKFDPQELHTSRSGGFSALHFLQWIMSSSPMASPGGWGDTAGGKANVLARGAKARSLTTMVRWCMAPRPGPPGVSSTRSRG